MKQMKTSHIRTIRENVIYLLRVSGYTVIEAVDLWDKVYSRDYELSKPGIKHAWHIGEYTFEFTKVSTDQPVTEPAQEVQTKSGSQVLTWLAVITAIIIVTGAIIYLF